MTKISQDKIAQTIISQEKIAHALKKLDDVIFGRLMSDGVNHNEGGLDYYPNIEKITQDARSTHELLKSALEDPMAALKEQGLVRPPLSEMNSRLPAIPLTMAYLVRGFSQAQMAQTSHPDFDALGEGEKEVISTLCQQASLVDQLVAPVIASGEYYGVFEYSVAEPLGAWYYKTLANNLKKGVNQHPDPGKLLDQAWTLLLDDVSEPVREQLESYPKEESLPEKSVSVQEPKL